MRVPHLGICLGGLLTAVAGLAAANPSLGFTNFVRQSQVSTGVVWDVTVPSRGEQLSPLTIDEKGARFELWTVQSQPLKSYLLDSTFVGSYIPAAQVVITTEDPGSFNGVPRTRADRPFRVEVVVDGLQTQAGAPEAAKRVDLLRHVQSYGPGGTGKGLDRSQAVRASQASLDANRSYPLEYALSSIPGPDRAKLRGEERFSVFTLADRRENYNVPSSQLASQSVQIWPVADGQLEGIEPGERLRFALPNLTVKLNDLYPDSTTYLQVYPGGDAPGTVGTVVVGSMLVIKEPTPQSRVLTVKDYKEVFTNDGVWTMELLTTTPFGIDRLDQVTFTVDRTLHVRGGIYTHE